MPCGLCNTWIDGEWIDWRECYVQPTEENRILVHTSRIPYLDIPCVLHLVLSVTGMYSWYFFCRACRANLTTQGGFPVESAIRLRKVIVPRNYPWDVPHWPVLVHLFQSSDSESSSDLSDNLWVGHLEWWVYISDVQHRTISHRFSKSFRACSVPVMKRMDWDNLIFWQAFVAKVQNTCMHRRVFFKLPHAT